MAGVHGYGGDGNCFRTVPVAQASYIVALSDRWQLGTIDEMVGWSVRRTVVITVATLLAAGCGDSDTPQGVETEGATSGPIPAGGSSSGDEMESATTMGSGSTTSTTGSSSETASTTSDGATTGPVEPPPATGIEIVHVTADQGVRIPIALDGSLVEGPARNLPVLQGRPALIRAFYELDPDFAERDIFAEITATQLDGTVTTYGSFETARHRDCEGEPEIDCRYGTLTQSFFWLLPAEDVQPGVTYSVRMLETAPGFEDVASDKVPVFPTSGGSLPIGVEDSYLKMRVVLVPIDHDLGADCPEPPDLEAEYGTDQDGNPRTVADFFRERLIAQNPADEVEIMVHDVVRWTGSLQGSQLLGGLQQLRFNENAPPEYYYYAVARPCDGGPDFSGVAQLGGPTVGEASNRVGWGVYHTTTSTTASTFVHEIGHEQGRRHVRCSGDEAGVNSSYPDHPDGNLLSWGTDVYAPQLEIHTPNGHDYMTYCSSSWVSEWGYDRVLPWIEEISSWELSALPPQQDLLVGNLRADGTQQWYTARGWLPETLVTPDARVRYTTEGSSVERGAARTTWEKSDDINVIAPLPDDWTPDTEVVWIDAGVELVVDRSKISAVGSLSIAAP